jgi:glycosyltransferase involved in cell wall biosynthesis
MARTAVSMTYNSPAANVLGLAEASARAERQPQRKLNLVAHNGANLVGGAELALIQLLRGLLDRGHRVSLACNHDIVADAAVGGQVPALVMPLRGDAVIADAYRFAQFLERESPDAFLLGTFKKIWLGGIAANRARVPRVVARVGLASDTPRRWKYRYAVQHWIHTVVLNADAMRSAFLAAVPAYDRDRVVTIHNGVARPARLKPAGAVRAELSIPATAQVIGAVARLSRQKRLERLIQTTQGLADVHCIIAGEGDQRAQLEALRAQLGLEQRVHLLGHRTDVGDVLAALDLFVVCSDQEGMANAMLEAMAAGLPVVSTPVSGAQEALRPLADGRQAGRVLASYAYNEMTGTVRDLLSKPPLLRLMAEAAEQAARERFDFDRMVSEYEIILSGGTLGRASETP